MQSFTPYFTGYENNPQQINTSQTQDRLQPQQQQPQQQQQRQQQEAQQQQQQTLNMNTSNLAVYPNPATMQPLSALAEAQKEMQNLQALEALGAHGKPKRKQVKNACVNCQKACKKCDIGRPCQRCIKYGLTDTCIDSVRKERKKGIKRGPYKKRSKSGNESATSSGASTPNMASPMTNPVLYANNAAAAAAAAAVRSNGLPIHYQAFSAPSHYDPFHGVTYPQGQMMPQAYMVPATAIQQMYSAANPPVLSYSGAMNMLSSQQQQQLQQQQQQQQQQHQQQQQQNQGGQATLNEDDDDEGNKLSILSRLCSEVLDNNDGSKQENNNVAAVKSESHQNTPPPSRPHSRETSHDNEGNHHLGHDSTPNFVNGHLAHHNNVIYGTPGSSPSDSSADTKFVKTENHQQQQQQQQHWVLPSVQSNTQ